MTQAMGDHPGDEATAADPDVREALAADPQTSRSADSGLDNSGTGSPTLELGLEPPTLDTQKTQETQEQIQGVQQTQKTQMTWLPKQSARAAKTQAPQQLSQETQKGWDGGRSDA